MLSNNCSIENNDDVTFRSRSLSTTVRNSWRSTGVNCLKGICSLCNGHPAFVSIISFYLVVLTIALIFPSPEETYGQTVETSSSKVMTVTSVSLFKPQQHFEMLASFIPPQTEVTVTEEVPSPVEDPPEPTLEEIQAGIMAERDISSNIGDDRIETLFGYMVRQELPTIYYPGVNFTYFKSFMNYSLVGKKTEAGKVVYAPEAYNDSLGLRRFTTDPATEFTVNEQFSESGDIVGDDDYMVAVGNFYKEKGQVNQRYLVVTTEGWYTLRVGDEKADQDTDPHHMFTWHCGKKYAGVLEFLVDQPNLERNIKRDGTVSSASVPCLGAEILYIYRIY